jgi:hypothetical protein
LNVIFELVYPAKFVSDYVQNTVERHSAERLGISLGPKFRKLCHAGLQEQPAGCKESPSRLLWKDVEEGHSKEDCTLVGGILLAKSGELFEQVFPPSRCDPVLLPRLPPLASCLTLCNPSVLHEFLQQRIYDVGVHGSAPENQPSGLFQGVSISRASEECGKQYKIIHDSINSDIL